MAAKRPPDAPSPSSPSTRLPLVDRASRRGSLASLPSPVPLDKDKRIQTLDQIHSSASQSQALTTFHDFASPPSLSSTGDGKTFADDIQGGLSGLYTKFRASVSAAKDVVVPGSPLKSAVNGDGPPKDLPVPRNLRPPKRLNPDVSSPVVLSTPSSRIQSPIDSRLSDIKIHNPNPADILHRALLTEGAATDSASSVSSLGNDGLSINLDGTRFSSLADGREQHIRELSFQSERGSVQLPAHAKYPRPTSAEQKSLPDSPAVDPATVQEHLANPTRLSNGSRQESAAETKPRGRPKVSVTSVDGEDTVAVNSHEKTSPEEKAVSSQQRTKSSDKIESHRHSEMTALATNEATMTSPPTSFPPLEDSLDPDRSQDRPPMLQISQSHLPGFFPSTASSTDGTELGSTSTVSRRVIPETPSLEEHVRRSHVHQQPSSPGRKKLLDKRFWMKDENAKDCFYCGDNFSTFRRKHHCRICGQIFDAKCTNLLPGRLFGQSSTVRICRPCEKIISGHDDDSSNLSESENESHINTEYKQIPYSRGSESGGGRPRSSRGHGGFQIQHDHQNMATPMMGIPVSRRTGESKRSSAVLEFEGQPMLARPSSSRSLRSVSGRPRSSSHKRHYSRHQHVKSWRTNDEKAPFQRNPGEESNKRTGLLAFHNDSIIDPDLAPFMSDDNSSGDDQSSIFTTMEKVSPNVSNTENDRNAISGLLAGLRKGRSRVGERSNAVSNVGTRDADSASLGGRPVPRHQRRRNLSAGSLSHSNRPSPKRSKSNSLLRSFGLGAGDIPGGSPLTLQTLAGSGPGLSKLKRSSSMRGSRAPAMELNVASMQHVRRLLKQMLRDAEISRVHSWENALIPILLQCTDDVDPNVQSGDDIDIRHYVKLKKAPGGSPGDTSYVSGVVFTKNVALKSMPRSILSPRIMIVSFAIEYARHHQHFMSLEPVIAQEREYLSTIVARIKALQPKVLLVQRSVSGLALEYLNEAHIAVVYNIKESVLNAVSRCTQTRIVSSIDRLAIEPMHLGKCESFDVKTYVHDGIKKSYIYISGCEPRLGCTIVLRGAKKQHLQRLKAVTEFMCYVVYNLKLETSLMRDEFVSIPSTVASETLSPTASSDTKCQQSALLAFPSGERDAGSKIDSTVETLHQDGEEHEPAPTAESVPTALQATTTTSSTDNEGFHRADEEPIPDDVPPPSYYSDMVEKHKTRALSSSPFVQFMLPYLLMKSREQERRLAHLKRLKDEYDPNRHESKEHQSTQKFELVKPEMVHGPLQRASRVVREFLYAVYDSEFDKAMHFYITQKRQWESYIAANVNLFDPLAHQNIAVLYSLVSTITSVPCAGPGIIALGFYGDHEYDADEVFDADCTLGQYVEDLCYGAGDVCKANGCGKRMYDHHRQYVHGDGQLSVFVEKYPSKFKGLEQTILMWSVCRICGQETQVIPMSENTWRYSFGKYLELSFWSSPLHARAGVCPHDIHRNHVRYFGLQNVAVRLQYDSVVLYEVIVPRPTITWKVDHDLGVKNDQYIKFQERLNRFMTSVKARLEGINVESVAGEKADACAAELDRLLKRANEDHDFLTRKLQDKYMNAKFYEVIPMNRAVRAMWEKALDWDDAFVAFERDFFPSEKDIRRLAALQLKRLFIERSSSTSSLTSLEDTDTDTETPNGKGLHIDEKGVPAGHMSVEKARDMMTSVVEEDSATTKSVQQKEDSPTEKRASDTSHVSPIPEIIEGLPSGTPQMHAVEREEVRHLDLAVPSSAPGNGPHSAPLQDTFSPTSISPQTTQDSQVSLESPVMQPISLDKNVAERLEQLENDKDANQLQAAAESKIPRLADSHKRRSLGTPAPPLLRALSHPVKSLHKENSNASTNGIALSPGPVTAALSSLQAETPSPAASATKSPEHRFTDRIGTNTIKAGKLLTQSLIPRSIHSKRLDSKVSTLAKHFEQLSREFEKERLKERKQRTARNRQSRLYPIASSKPVVEVYKDAKEALQDRDPVDDEPSNTTTTRQSTDNITTDDSKSTTGSAPTVDTTSPENEHAPHRVQSRLDHTDAEDTDLETKGQITDAEAEASDTEPLIFDDLEGSQSLVEEGHPILSSEDPHLDLDLDLPKHEKTSLMKMLTSFWSERSASGWMPLEYPLIPTEHVWTDSDIIVREDEPSCIIALALSSPDYQAKLQRFRKVHADNVEEKRRGSIVGGEESGIDNEDLQLQQQLSSSDEYEDAILERSLLGDTGTNMKYSFQHGSVKAQCKIFYAESFDALRRKCGVADRFIESMSRCLKWDSKGGKTKSLFLKTLDDRFVLKSLSKVEIDHFTKFAPDYFSFMAETMFHGMPSVIAKMFGLFHVVIKNPATGVEFNWFLLVMENLFYDRQLTRRFDLKGSMRNRKIESTGQKDEVLLDENLVETIFESPLFVREHSKKLLKASVYNDTLFLSKQNVMDYSLMAGIDDQRREMVVGIIGISPTFLYLHSPSDKQNHVLIRSDLDCIRTYTWDKKLESWIKDRGKNKPTITSPKDYRNRFRVSISNYFLQAPNCWHQFQAQQMQRQQPVRLETKMETNEETEVEAEPVINV